jgi:hypothetical protein
MIRDHWAIESSLHWVMDMVFRDDECRARTENAPASDRLLSQHHRPTDLRRHAIGPRSFDDQSPRDNAAGFDDAGQFPLASARMLAWNETDEGHELARIIEAPHVADLRYHHGGDHERDATQRFYTNPLRCRLTLWDSRIG